MADVAAEAVRPWLFRVGATVRRPVMNHAVEALALLGGMTLWEVLGRTLALPWLPPFSSVVAALVEFVQQGVILPNLAVSLQALGIGFVISLAGGVVVGALIGRYRRVEQALNIYVHAFFVAPSMIFAPIFFAIFGLGDATRIAVIVMYALFVIIINTASAVRIVDPALVEMARSLGASERQIMLEILVPGALPLMLAGIRLGMGRAVKGMINSEMYIALVGLGALAQRYGSQFETAKVFAVSLVVLIVALVAVWIVQTIDARLTRWAD